MLLASHGLTVCYSAFRSIQTAMLLFGGLKFEHVKNVFQDIATLRSPKFGENDFLEIYNRTVGYFEEDYDKRKQYAHNFLYICT